jgi:DNA-binding transcriptional MerR regulator
MPDHSRAKTELPPIPAKRYFTIGEVSDLCAVKPHVLRYWEQEFAQLKPVKRRGNRRYYQHHEVLLIRRIRDLLYEQGFTINGARHRLESDIAAPSSSENNGDWMGARDSVPGPGTVDLGVPASRFGWSDANAPDPVEIRQELEEIRRLLGHDS